MCADESKLKIPVLEAEPIIKVLEDLDVNCIETIFKFLPLNDLAAFSLTCKTYKTWAEQYFDRNSECGEIWIDADETVRFFQYFAEQFEVRFRSLIRSIVVEIWKPDLMMETCSFIRKNCAKQLKSIRCNCSCKGYHFTEIHVNVLAEQIKKLKKFTIHCLQCGNIILQHCKELQVLNIYMYGIPDGYKITTINETFPNLSILILKVPDEIRFDLTEFLKNNPQLKAIYCGNSTAFKCLCMTQNCLSYAAIHFVNETQLLDNWIDFKNCCKWKMIRTLDLVVGSYISDSTYRAIFDLNYVQGIHYSVDINNATFDEMSIQQNIKRLCMYFPQEFTNQKAEEIVKYFPNLNELRICENRALMPKLPLKGIIMPFISQIVDLKHLYIDIDVDRSTTDLHELENARSNLKDAFTVNVHLKANNSKEHQTQFESSLIVMQFEPSMDCPLCSGAKLESYIESICSTL